MCYLCHHDMEGWGVIGKGAVTRVVTWVSSVGELHAIVAPSSESRPLCCYESHRTHTRWSPMRCPYQVCDSSECGVIARRRVLRWQMCLLVFGGDKPWDLG